VRVDKEINDFQDTAAIMMSLDLIISSDTSIVNLAGALGRPVWVLLPFISDWRWLLNRNNTPWYPPARLFRQVNIGDWTTVMGDVCTELKKLVAR
jgi:ADP-heptose:LPS heptosyltransferase